MTQASADEYLLGINKEELDRLRYQHSVWGGITNQFFDRLKVGKGWKCLDVGAGPGFVSANLSERVGASGEVTALEPSKMFLEWFREEARRGGRTNVNFINASVEDAELTKGKFDFIFARWVIAFVPDPEKFLARLVPALRRGGIIAIQDYYYEGLSLFPHGGAFDRMADVVRAYYRSGCGDAYLTGKLPAMLKDHGLQTIDFSPHSLAGGPDSGVMEWAHRFFSVHIQHMVDKHLLSQKDGDAMLADWMAHRANPDAIFFSPIVVDVAAVRPDRQ